MKRSKRGNLFKLSAIFVGVLIFSIVIISPETIPFQGNQVSFSLAQLALVQDHSAMDCDMWNTIYATYESGSKVKLGEGREGAVQPFIDSSKISQLSLQVGGNEIQSVQVALEAECSGDAMDGATTVSGTNWVRISSDPSGATTKYLYGDSGTCSGLSCYDSLSIPTTALSDGVRTKIFEVSISESNLEATWGSSSGSTFLKSEMYADMTFNFIHPTAGSFSGSVDMYDESKKVVGQYGSISRTLDATTDPDSDGDGIPDGSDQCPTQAETFNGYQDGDGCPDTEQVTGDPDNDGDSIPDSEDQCPSDPETFNGYEDTDGCPDTLGKSITINSYDPAIFDKADSFQAFNVNIGIENYETSESAPALKLNNEMGTTIEQFSFPGVCLIQNTGTFNCAFSVTADLSKYDEGSYVMEVESASRGSITAPLEVVNSGGNQDSDNDGIPDKDDPCPADPNNVCTEDDFDGDGLPDDVDTDDDNDFIPDVDDPCPKDPRNDCDNPELESPIFPDVNNQVREFFLDSPTSTPLEISDEDIQILALMGLGAVGLIGLAAWLKKKKK